MVACYTAGMEITPLELPEALREIPEAPKQLFVRGVLPAAQPVAIVGSRRATPYGRHVASRLGARLAGVGIPVVSGLAFGIDVAAHLGVLDAGGRSIAVLPGGLDERSISPQSHVRIAERITQHGALISEYPAGTESRKEHYLARNRLISGLSRCVIVVEAELPSGSLVTAKHALTQGIDVWAVPGPIDRATSRGTNGLIDEGARPLVDINLFLESLGAVGVTKIAHPLLEALESGPKYLDELLSQLPLTPQEVRGELTKLELVGAVWSDGGRYTAA